MVISEGTPGWNEDYAPEESPRPVEGEERAFGRYVLGYELARGGMGTVFLARDVRPGGFDRPVALKRIHAHLADLPSVADMFLDEARIQSRINHPNVCSIYDFGEVDGTWYIAMEHLSGASVGSLMARIADRPEALDEPRWHAIAARIVAEAAEGLHAAHELTDPTGEPMHVVHRDVSPQNVLVTFDGAVKILDFGVARARGRLHQTTEGGVKGKLAYMAPEQIGGHAVDRRADIWSLGVCLWEMLTGHRLFRSKGEMDTLLAIRSREVRRPSAVRPSVPVALDEICLSALRRPPAERPATARELSRALTGYLRTQSESTERADVGERVRELSGDLAAVDAERVRTALGLVPSTADSTGSAPGDAIHDRRLVRPGDVTATVAPASVRAAAPSIPPDAPLVGRAPELALLEAIAVAARQECRRTVALVGGPTGIGKTSLLRALEARLREQRPPPTVIAAAASPRTREQTMGLLGHLMRAAGGEDDRAIESLLQARIGDRHLARECARALSARAEPARADTAAVADPRWLEDRLRAGAVALITAFAADGPLVLMLDDLHWADPASLDALERALEANLDAPLLIVGAARREPGDETVPLGEDIRHEIWPRPLSRADVARLASRVAGRALPVDRVESVAARSGGNPLFVEQIVHALLEHGPVDRAPAELPTPEDVRGAVAARLAALPRPERLALCAVAALGGAVDEGAVGSVAGLDDPATTLRSLSRRRLLVRGVGPDGRRTHRAATELFAEVALERMPAPERERMHAAAAAWVAAVQGRDRAVARHLERAGHATEAAAAWVREAERCAERGDGRGTLAATGHALRLGVPEAARFLTHALRAEALAFSGPSEARREHLDAAEAAARGADERARALLGRASLLASAGRNEEAVSAAAEAVGEARRAAHRELLARALVRLAWPAMYAGDLETASAALAEAGALGPHLSVSSAAHVSSWQSQLLAMRGDLAGRRRECEVASALYREAGDLRGAALADMNLGDVLNRVGAYDEAAAALRQTIRLCRQVGNPEAEAYARLNLAYALAGTGRGEEALAELDAAVRAGRSAGEHRVELVASVYRVRARLAGSPGEVGAEADAAAEACGDAGLPALRIAALALASDAWRRAGDVERALDRSTGAVAALERLGALEEDEADVFLAHARALDAAGRSREAARARARGRRRVVEIASRIEDDELRARFLTDVPAHRDLWDGEA